jgi:EmrB/QacA subfamily drug resistance transporter
MRWHDKSAVPESTSQSGTVKAQPDWTLIAVVLTGTFMAVLDFFIVNVAIPDLRIELGASASQIQFVVAGYAIAYGSSLLVGSRLGDIFGRRRMFLVGLAGFTLSSAACGLAPNANIVVTGRILQGFSAALLSPQILAIIAILYEGEAKARALNAYGSCMGFAAVFGQVIGGLLISTNAFGWGWRTCFLINLPIGIGALACGAKIIPESRDPRPAGLDLSGMALIGCALLAATLPLIEGRELGWPWWSWTLLGITLLLLLIFVRHERSLKSSGKHPLMDIDLFAQRSFTVGVLAQLTCYMSMASFYLVFAVYAQEGCGLSPLASGSLFIAHGIGYLFGSSSARAALRALGGQALATAAMLRCIGLAFLLLPTIAGYFERSILWMVPGLFVSGIGTGLAISPLAATVLAHVPASNIGIASGILTTSIQVGNAIGVAAIGTIFYQLLVYPEYGHAFAWSLIYLIAINAAFCLLVQFLPRD